MGFLIDLINYVMLCYVMLCYVVMLCFQTIMLRNNGMIRMYVLYLRYLHIINYRITVKPVYKEHSRVPKNVPFMSSCPLYTGSNYIQCSLMEKMRLSFIDSDLFYMEVPFKAGLTVLETR